MVHISLGGFTVYTVKFLRLAECSESCNGKNLCLTSRKESGTVNSLEKTDFSCKRSDLVKRTTVNTLFINKQPAANDLLLKLVHKFGKDSFDIGIFFRELLDDCVLNRLHSCVADVFVVSVKCEHKVFFAESEYLVEHIMIKLA